MSPTFQGSFPHIHLLTPPNIIELINPCVMYTLWILMRDFCAASSLSDTCESLFEFVLSSYHVQRVLDCHTHLKYDLPKIASSSQLSKQ